jgi:excinuclease UvrABC helicase subunit UvrB
VIEFNRDEIEARIKDLDHQMKELAAKWRFEEAAKIRDELKELRGARLLL